MRVQRGEGSVLTPTHLENQIVICFLRNSSTDSHREAIGPLGSIASRGRCLRPSVTNKKTNKQKIIINLRQWTISPSVMIFSSLLVNP